MVENNYVELHDNRNSEDVALLEEDVLVEMETGING